MARGAGAGDVDTGRGQGGYPGELGDTNGWVRALIKHVCDKRELESLLELLALFGGESELAEID
jgi:hypothetical protein